ncbi:hypothetical protein [Desulfopila inferna]|uniref:hypothetical protein n=1 Tax=Desulfopila inferna TaxID=468528 RepID=UPI0019666CAD|nr:hypothetical protein [Desulfopila inferna]
MKFTVKIKTRYNRGAIIKSIFTFNNFLIFLILCFFMFITYSYADADTPIAADLVDGGQKIDLNQPEYQELFEELRHGHCFSRAGSNFAGAYIH